MYANVDENENPFASKKAAVQNSPVGGSSKANNFSQAMNNEMSNEYPDPMESASAPSNLI